MKNSQKGFVLLLLLAIMAVLLVGGGAYMYVQNKQTTPIKPTMPIPPLENCPVIATPSCVGKPILRADGCQVGFKCDSGTLPKSPIQTASFSASPTSGSVPLAVRFTGNTSGVSYFGGVEVNFGDGSTSNFCNPLSDCGTKTVSHTYFSPGTYIATLTGIGEGSSKVFGTVIIRVTSAP